MEEMGCHCVERQYREVFTDKIVTWRKSCVSVVHVPTLVSTTSSPFEASHGSLMI